MSTRILLVDDYEGFVSSVSAALDLRGLPVTRVATSAVEAAAAIDGQAFEAVITDFDLGWGDDGRVVARYAIDNGVPLVILWSSVSRDTEMKGNPLLDEPDFYLMEKPGIGNASDVLAKVSKLLVEFE